MTKTLLLLFGLMPGIAAASGANEARAVAMLDAVRSVAQTTPEGSFVSIGFKRHGFHRAPGVVHKKLGGPRSFAGKRFGHGGVVGRDESALDPSETTSSSEASTLDRTASRRRNG